MKEISTSTLLLFLAFSLFGQEYCPCEDQTYGEEDNFLSYTSSSDFFMNFSQQKKQNSYSLMVQEPIIPEMSESKTHLQLEDTDNDTSSGTKKKIVKKKKVKGKKWLFKRPLKRKRTFKKYKGQCPVF